MTTGVVAAVKIFYTPYVSNALPIFDGTNWQLSTLIELEMSLDASVHTSATNYDVFAVNDGGTRRIGTASAWASDTARAISIQRLNGIWTNMSTTDIRYGSATVSAVSANRATYLGTFRTTSVIGQTEYSLGGTSAGGQASNLYIWNAYNRAYAAGLVRDNTDSWSYTSAVWRAANNSVGNRCSFIRGLDEDEMTAIYWAIYSASPNAFNGVQLDGVTGFVGVTGINQSTTFVTTAPGAWSGWPGIGLHFIQAVEYGNVTAATFYGDAGLITMQTGLIVQGMF